MNRLRTNQFPSISLVGVLIASLGLGVNGCSDEDGMGGRSADPPSSMGGSSVPPDRFAWWREARFGMFIHWGLYSVLAGEWKGRRIRGLGEWILHDGKLPQNEYNALAQQFNPVGFNAAEWAGIARDAGMKYIVITTKHHDGFALYRSQAGEFDLGASLEKRNLLLDLANAARAEGLRMGWYYSILDWHHPHFTCKPGRWSCLLSSGSGGNRNFDLYFKFMKDQLTELLTGFGDIGVLWFDGEWTDSWTSQYGRQTYALARRLQPNILVNNRVGKGRDPNKPGYVGDFLTPEQKIPGSAVAGKDFESCITMNDTWGFKRYDNNWKSVGTLLRMLAETASKGGNLLLNVGPDGNGKIPQPSVDRLRAMGRWLAERGESIYGTQGCPFGPQSWGMCTRKRLQNNTERLYMHVIRWSAQLQIQLNPNQTVTGATLLGTAAQPVQYVQQGTRVDLTLPTRPRHEGHPVIALDLNSQLSLASGRPATASNVYRQQAAYAARMAVDDYLETRWATDDAIRSAWLEVDLGAPARIGRVFIDEPAVYQRVQAFELQTHDGRSWRTFYRGSTIGPRHNISISPITAQRVRLNILSASVGPTIAEFQLFGP